MDYEESLMIKAAWYYYFEEMTQQHVAELMGITRMRVIKLLEKARQTGIIQFRLRKDGESRMQLERNLMSAFGLQDAFVIPAAIDRSGGQCGRGRGGQHVYQRAADGKQPHQHWLRRYPQPHSQQPRHPGRAAAHLRIAHRRGQLLSARHPQQRIQCQAAPDPRAASDRQQGDGRGAPPRGQRHGAQPHDGPRPDDGGRRGRHARDAPPSSSPAFSTTTTSCI